MSAAVPIDPTIGANGLAPRYLRQRWAEAAQEARAMAGEALPVRCDSAEDAHSFDAATDELRRRLQQPGRGARGRIALAMSLVGASSLVGYSLGGAADLF